MDDQERISLARYLSKYIKERFTHSLQYVPEEDMFTWINEGIKDWQIRVPAHPIHIQSSKEENKP